MIQIKMKIKRRLIDLLQIYHRAEENKREAEITENTTKAENCQREITIYKAKIHEVEAILRLFK